jgi:hypothetical protein
MVSRFMREGGNAETIGQPLGCYAQLHLALTPQNHLVRFRIVLDADRGILLKQLVQRLAELDVVLAFLAGNCHGEHGRIGPNLRQRRMRLLAGGERIAGIGVIKLGERHGLAGLRGAPLLGGLAEKLEHASHPAGVALGRDKDGAVGDLAIEHADNRHFAAVRCVQGLHHIGHRIIARFEAEALGGVGHPRRLMAQRLHQAQHAIGACRRPEQHGAYQAFAQLLGKVVEDLVTRRLDVLEQLLHELVIVVGKRLEHGEARRLLAVEGVSLQRNHFRARMLAVYECSLEREIDEAADRLAGKCRDLPQQQLAAGGRLQQGEHVMDGRVRLVDLVEKQKARDLAVFKLAQDEVQLRHLLFVELADHDRGIDRGKRRAHLVHEFNGTRTVDERVVVAHEACGRDGDLDAHLVVARFLAGVAHGVASIDRSLALDRAGTGKDRFEQGRLAALERAHQRDAPGTRSSCAVLCHIAPPPPR